MALIFFYIFCFRKPSYVQTRALVTVLAWSKKSNFFYKVCSKCRLVLKGH